MAPMWDKTKKTLAEDMSVTVSPTAGLTSKITMLSDSGRSIFGG